MSLDQDEQSEVIQLAARVTAEMIRNTQRGTGGATAPSDVTRLGTVAGAADNGGETLVRPDGDLNAVPAINVSGFALDAGERVMVEWKVGGGVYITNITGRSASQLWTPTLTGTGGTTLGNGTSYGTASRTGDVCTLRARVTTGSTSNTGTVMNLANMPWPVKTTGNGVPAIGTGYFYNLSNVFPAWWVVQEGNTVGPMYALLVIAAGGYPPLVQAGSGIPFAWGTGHDIDLAITYETDAA